MNLSRSVGIAVVVAAGTLSALGCKKHRKTDEDTTQDQEPAAAAAPADTGATAAAPAATGTAEAAPVAVPEPPADQAETQGVAPSPHHSWVHGYWHWAGGRYVWQAGYWGDNEVATTVAPPPLRTEVVTAAPGAAYFYAPGYWRWGGTSYLWAPGHWARRRDGYVYTHPYWESVNGRWYRRGWGWERHDAAWDRRYVGWEHRGDVWVHRGYVHEWDHRWDHEHWGRHRRF